MDINVMWIDDECEEWTLFIDLCEIKGLNVEPFKTSSEGMAALYKNPDHWDAIVLDAKGFINNIDEQQSLKGLRNSIKHIDRISYKKDIPYFILTGQGGVMSDEQFMEEHENVYFKIGNCDNNTNKLIEDIILRVKDNENVIIRKKYHKIFDNISSVIEDETLGVLKIIEHDEDTNADIFNKIRKILDWLMMELYEYGLLPNKYKGSELGKCSTFLSKADLNDYVPLYIRRSLHACTEISNNGSHRMAIDQDVKEGKAPYLLKSTVYELLNILIWFQNLPQDSETRDKIAAIVTNIVPDESENKQKKKKSTN